MKKEAASAKSLGFQKGDFVYTGSFPGILVSDLHTSTPIVEVWGMEHEMGGVYATDLKKITGQQFMDYAREWGFDGRAYSREAQKALKMLSTYAKPKPEPAVEAPQAPEQLPPATAETEEQVKPVSIYELASHVLGREATNGADYEELGLPMMGGCADCHASIAAFNSYPSKTGYLMCKDCIGDSGWTDLETAHREVFADDAGGSEGLESTAAHPNLEKEEKPVYETPRDVPVMTQRERSLRLDKLLDEYLTTKKTKEPTIKMSPKEVKERQMRELQARLKQAQPEYGYGVQGDVYVKCKGEHMPVGEAQAEFLNIEEGMQGEDILTFKCSFCGQPHKSAITVRRGSDRWGSKKQAAHRPMVCECGHKGGGVFSEHSNDMGPGYGPCRECECKEFKGVQKQAEAQYEYFCNGCAVTKGLENSTKAYHVGDCDSCGEPLGNNLAWLGPLPRVGSLKAADTQSQEGRYEKRGSKVVARKEPKFSFGECKVCGDPGDLVDGLCGKCAGITGSKKASEEDMGYDEGDFFAGWTLDEKVEFERRNNMCDKCPHPSSDHDFSKMGNYACQMCAIEGGACAKGYPGYEGGGEKEAASTAQKICAWCGKHMGHIQGEFSDDIPAITHGICQDCFTKVRPKVASTGCPECDSVNMEEIGIREDDPRAPHLLFKCRNCGAKVKVEPEEKEASVKCLKCGGDGYVWFPRKECRGAHAVPSTTEYCGCPRELCPDCLGKGLGKQADRVYVVSAYGGGDVKMNWPNFSMDNHVDDEMVDKFKFILAKVPVDGGGQYWVYAFHIGSEFREEGDSESYYMEKGDPVDAKLMGSYEGEKSDDIEDTWTIKADIKHWAYDLYTELLGLDPVEGALEDEVGIRTLAAFELFNQPTIDSRMVCMAGPLAEKWAADNGAAEGFDWLKIGDKVACWGVADHYEPDQLAESHPDGMWAEVMSDFDRAEARKKMAVVARPYSELLDKKVGEKKNAVLDKTEPDRHVCPCGCYAAGSPTTNMCAHCLMGRPCPNKDKGPETKKQEGKKAGITDGPFAAMGDRQEGGCSYCGEDVLIRAYKEHGAFEGKSYACDKCARQNRLGRPIPGDFYNPENPELGKVAEIPGGKADGQPDDLYSPDELKKGIEVEMEHVEPANDAKAKDDAKDIAKDHLEEQRQKGKGKDEQNYYKLLEKHVDPHKKGSSEITRDDRLGYYEVPEDCACPKCGSPAGEEHRDKRHLSPAMTCPKCRNRWMIPFKNKTAVLVEVDECPTCHRKKGEKHKATMQAPSMEEMEEWMNDGVAEATDGCRVEPDGRCEHGHMSWLLRSGLI